MKSKQTLLQRQSASPSSRIAQERRCQGEKARSNFRSCPNSTRENDRPPLPTQNWEAERPEKFLEKEKIGKIDFHKFLYVKQLKQIIQRGTPG